MQQPKPWPGVSSFTCGQVIASNSSPTSTIGWNEHENTKIYEKKRVVRKVTENEWAKFVAIILISSGFEDNGENVWAKPSVDNFFGHHEIKTRTGISLTRFKQINAKFVLSFVDPLKKNESDP